MRPPLLFGATKDLGRGAVEAVRLTGQREGRCDLFHLRHPAPTFRSRGCHGALRLLRSSGSEASHSASRASSTPFAPATSRIARRSAAVPFVQAA